VFGPGRGSCGRVCPGPKLGTAQSSPSVLVASEGRLDLVMRSQAEGGGGRRAAGTGPQSSRSGCRNRRSGRPSSRRRRDCRHGVPGNRRPRRPSSDHRPSGWFPCDDRRPRSRTISLSRCPTTSRRSAPGRYQVAPPRSQGSGRASRRCACRFRSSASRGGPVAAPADPCPRRVRPGCRIGVSVRTARKGAIDRDRGGGRRIPRCHPDRGRPPTPTRRGLPARVPRAGTSRDA
jgi:hypothetical protein